MKFKVGDKVKAKKGHEGECGNCEDHDYLIITSVSGTRYDYDSYVNGTRDSSCHLCYGDEDLTLLNKAKIKPPKPPKFILQYEIDEDPIEEFNTLTAVKKRIKELVKDGGHSFKVYEIKNMIVPEIEEKNVIIIKGL